MGNSTKGPIKDVSLSCIADNRPAVSWPIKQTDPFVNFLKKHRDFSNEL
jgi:hypothetical protein